MDSERRTQLKRRVDLTLALAENDFKSKYAGSQLGILWAFVKPVVQACVYIFVFSIVARATPEGTSYPYAFWFLPGIVAWFFFSDGALSGARALLDYSYLVKKVKFDISILPYVKVLSAGIVHLFFVALVLVMYLIAGLPMCWTMVQIPYYMACTLCLTVALARINCALTPFFRDFLQLLEIVLMVLMWACPVMWDITMLPAKLAFFFKLNPLFYVINGYRQAYMNGGWFFQQPWMTLYFWGVTAVLLFLGGKLFDNLKVHFADII